MFGNPMFSKASLAIILCALLGLSIGRAHAQASPRALSATADPSSQQIYDAARAGRMGQAERMIEQVLRDHPNNAKAHYVAAEVYAHAGNYPRARNEFNRAQSISPGLPFASSNAVAALERQLAGPSTRSSARHSVSWGAVVLVVALIAVAWALLSRRRRMYGAMPGQPGYPGVTPYPGPYPGGQYPGVTPYGAPMGGGIMRNIASGMAIGAGMAAGEAVVDRMMGRGGGVIPQAQAGGLGESPADPNADMGGQDFGLTDNSGWSDGGGGGDWGGGDLSGGGDLGGGGDWT